MKLILKTVLFEVTLLVGLAALSLGNYLSNGWLAAIVMVACLVICPIQFYMEQKAKGVVKGRLNPSAPSLRKLRRSWRRQTKLRQTTLQPYRKLICG